MVDIVKQDQWCHDPEAWRRETLAKKVVEALKANWFDALYVPDREAAAEYILGYCKPGVVVAHGGSATLTRDMGMLDRVKATGATLIENAYGTPEEMFEARRKQLTSDVFLTSTNAVTLDGKLVNVDGAGNRVATMIFGPKKVILVVGINKIVRDLEAAEERIRMYAAPLNNRRLNLPNPCTKSGECMDCEGASRICNVTTILRKKPMFTDIHVFVVGEELGF